MESQTQNPNNKVQHKIYLDWCFQPSNANAVICMDPSWITPTGALQWKSNELLWKWRGYDYESISHITTIYGKNQWGIKIGQNMFIWHWNGQTYWDVCLLHSLLIFSLGLLIVLHCSLPITKSFIGSFLCGKMIKGMNISFPVL